MSRLKELTISCSNTINPLTKRKFTATSVNALSVIRETLLNVNSVVRLAGDFSLTSAPRRSLFLTVLMSRFKIKNTQVSNHSKLIIKTGIWVFK